MDREVEAVAEPHAHGPVPAIGVDAAIDRRLVFLARAAKEVEQTAARLGRAATAIALHGALELLLTPPVAAASERGPLRLEAFGVPPRVLDAGV